VFELYGAFRPLDRLLLSFPLALEYYRRLGHQCCNSPGSWELHNPMDGGWNGSELI
ncbi:hypothetical protein Tco_0355913, partial [Tanacetum coccineum]